MSVRVYKGGLMVENKDIIVSFSIVPNFFVI